MTLTVILLTKEIHLKYLLVIIALVFLGCDSNVTRLAKSNSVKTEASSEIANELEQIIRQNYRDMESEEISKILASYHPETNLPSSRAQLEGFYAVAGMKYTIDDVRYIGNDGTNYVVIYREKTEFHKKGGLANTIVDTEDTNVLMVFRKHEDELKVFTSRTLKPNAG